LEIEDNLTSLTNKWQKPNSL